MYVGYIIKKDVIVEINLLEFQKIIRDFFFENVNIFY